MLTIFHLVPHRSVWWTSRAMAPSAVCSHNVLGSLSSQVAHAVRASPPGGRGAQWRASRNRSARACSTGCRSRGERTKTLRRGALAARSSHEGR
eukprot:5362033-Alexandrium_andersonii.AAC.1